MQRFASHFIGLVVLGTVSPVAVAAGTETEGSPAVYVTWEGSEPDKGASAWLIKRFVDPEAVIKTTPREADIKEGTAFDVPQSRFSRTPRFSAYETLLHAFSIDDPVAVRLGVITHDIEINTWGPKLAWETPFVQKAVWELQQLFREAPITLVCHIAFFDEVYGELRQNDGRVLDIEIPEACRQEADGVGRTDSVAPNTRYVEILE